MGPRVEALAKSRADTVLRVIDIESWDSPVARSHGIRSIPHLVLYRDGRLEAEGNGAVLSRLNR